MKKIKRAPKPKARDARPEYKIGATVRRARLASNLKLQELADRCGLSKALLSRIENDKINPSISSLHEIAGALGINLSGLFGEGQQFQSKVVLRKGERQVIEFKSDGSTIENFIPFGGTNMLQAF